MGFEPARIKGIYRRENMAAKGSIWIMQLHAVQKQLLRERDLAPDWIFGYRFEFDLIRSYAINPQPKVIPSAAMRIWCQLKSVSSCEFSLNHASRSPLGSRYACTL